MKMTGRRATPSSRPCGRGTFPIGRRSLPLPRCDREGFFVTTKALCDVNLRGEGYAGNGAAPWREALGAIEIARDGQQSTRDEERDVEKNRLLEVVVSASPSQNPAEVAREWMRRLPLSDGVRITVVLGAARLRSRKFVAYDGRVISVQEYAALKIADALEELVR